MKTISIQKIDTTTDWFADTVERIESLTGADADWEAIDSDQNTLGDLMGYYRKDGTLYRAEHDPSRSDSETDCIVFEEQEESAYEITGESGHGWLIESAISEAHALHQYYAGGDAEPHLAVKTTDDEAHMEYLRDMGQASGVRRDSIAEKQEESAYSLQHAIDSTECSIGYWTIDKDEDRTMLVWRGDIEDLPEDMEGDEPWKKWGGDEILDKAGIDILSHATGIDSYTDQYGDEVQEQWVIIEGE